MRPDFEAYWLLPNGKIHSVKATHIQEVTKCPEEFGETLANIKNLYDADKEKMPFEGKARVKIMKRILQRGYIRIREKRNHWMIELYKLSQTENKLISQWVNYIWDDLSDKYSETIINTLQDNASIILPIREFHNV